MPIQLGPNTRWLEVASGPTHNLQHIEPLYDVTHALTSLLPEARLAW